MCLASKLPEKDKDELLGSIYAEHARILDDIIHKDPDMLKSLNITLEDARLTAEKDYRLASKFTNFSDWVRASRLVEDAEKMHSERDEKADAAAASKPPR
jgi:hypothetical protein